MEELRNVEYVVAAYGISFTLIFGYLISLVVRRKKADRLRDEIKH